MKALSRACILSTLCLIPLQGHTTCALTDKTLTMIQEEPALAALQQMYQDLWDQAEPDCELVEKLNAHTASAADDMMASDLVAYCKPRHEVALAYVDQMNMVLGRECLDKDCSGWLEVADRSPYVLPIGDVIYLADATQENASQRFQNRGTALTLNHWLGQTIFDRCGNMTIRLIQAENMPDGLASRVNRALEDGLESFIVDLKYGNTTDKAVFNKLQQENYFDYTVEQNPIWHSYGLLSVQTSSYMFTGGAHGISGQGYVNIDLNDGKALKLEDVFEPSKKEALLSLVEHQLRNWASQNAHVANDASFQEMGFLFNPEYIPEKAKAWSGSSGLYVTDNFYVADDGLHLVYNPYEIGPYAFGIIDLPLAWSDLDALLKPGSAVSQLLNE